MQLECIFHHMYFQKGEVLRRWTSASILKKTRNVSINHFRSFMSTIIMSNITEPTHDSEMRLSGISKLLFALLTYKVFVVQRA